MPSPAAEYETKAKPENKSKPKKNPVPKWLLNTFTAPSDCTDEDFRSRIRKVAKARVRDYDIVYRQLKALRNDSQYQEATLEKREMLEEEAKVGRIKKRLEDGEHFTLVAKALGLVMNEEARNRPELELANNCMKSLSSPSHKQDHIVSERQDPEESTILEQSKNVRCKPPVESDGGSRSEKASVGPARKRLTYTLTASEDEPARSEGRPRKLVKSLWKSEWESLKFSFDVLYREVQAKRQGLKEYGKERNMEGPAADAQSRNKSTEAEMLEGRKIETEESTKDGNDGIERQKEETSKDGTEKQDIMEKKKGKKDMDMKEEDVMVEMEDSIKGSG